MTIKRIITEVGGFIGRGFRYERYDYTEISSAMKALDYCNLIKVMPAGFAWKAVRMVVGGPVSTSGTLELFSRHVRKETAHRYTVTFETDAQSDGSYVFAIPVTTATASIGVVGIYFCTADGQEHSYITPGRVTVKRGGVTSIVVPPPASGEKPSVTEG